MAWVAPPARTLAARSTRTDAAAHAAGQLGADPGDQIVVLPAVLCRVEIDELHFGPAAEAVDPFVDGVTLEREAFALDELDDAAAHQIDGGDEHLYSFQLPVASCQCSVSQLSTRLFTDYWKLATGN